MMLAQRYWLASSAVRNISALLTYDVHQHSGNCCAKVHCVVQWTTVVCIYIDVSSCVITWMISRYSMY